LSICATTLEGGINTDGLKIDGMADRTSHSSHFLPERLSRRLRSRIPSFQPRRSLNMSRQRT
jgi:hypothetical protein